MSDDDYTTDYYDGELALWPFLRAWARDRWTRLRLFVRYRVLRRKLPALPAGPPSATLATLDAIYKQAYGTTIAEDLATRPGGAFAALMKREREALIPLGPRPALYDRLTRLRRATFKASDLEPFHGTLTMRCVVCGHEQPLLGSGAQHCGKWMAPVNGRAPS